MAKDLIESGRGKKSAVMRPAGLTSLRAGKAKGNSALTKRKMRGHR